MWAGARISHGFSQGKICYEAKVTSEFNNMAGVPKDTTGALPADDEKIPSLVRLGWSVIGTSLQLGNFYNFRVHIFTATVNKIISFISLR